MNELLKTWPEGWTAHQQALMQSMFPLAAFEGTKDATPPLEQHFAELRDTWTASIEKWSKLASDNAQAGRLTPDVLRELFVPTQWSGSGASSFDGALRHVLEGPKYATLWNLDRKLAKLQQHALKRDSTMATYQAVVQEAWNLAFTRFSSGFSSSDEQTSATWRGLVDRWLAVANETLVEVQRSSEFIEAQRAMLRATSDYRLTERRLAEAWCEANHFPTRTEMDELQRTVTELRRQLRSQQRSTASPRADAVAPSTATTARTKPRRAVASRRASARSSRSPQQPKEP